jgi:phage terminase large subunit-like protein
MSKSPNEAIGRLVKLARLRQERDLAHADRGLWFDREAADRAVKFFAYLRHTKGEWAGKPFHLEPWQENDIIRPLFGWKRPDGTRRYRTGYISVARKNGKSPLVAGCGLYLEVADNEPGAEVYSTATKRDQARIVLDYAGNMVLRSPQLKKWVQTYRSREGFHSLSVLRTGSRFQALSSDADTLDGLSTHGGIIDELHAHKNRKVWDVIRTSTSARRQPLVIAITTAGYDRKSICWEVHQRAVQVLERALEDDSFFVYIATVDKKDSWEDEHCWPKANPNLGVSKKWDYMRDEFRAAKAAAGLQNTFRRLDLNQWTEQSSRAIDMDAWHACAGHVDPEELNGQRCFGGLDLSSVLDLTALALIFPVEQDGRKVYKSLTFFWLPERAIARRSVQDGIPYDVWAEKGYIKLTPGSAVDYEVVRADIRALASRYKIVELAIDRWNAQETFNKLAQDGLKAIEFGQGYKSMSEPTKKFLGMILDQRFEHGANPVLTWNAANLAVSQDPAGQLKPDKEKSTEKIDGIASNIMAVGRALLHEPAASAYDKRGIRFI